MILGWSILPQRNLYPNTSNLTFSCGTMKTRLIYTKFWEDSYICSLSFKEKLAFLYLFTNSRVNLCGIYELPDKFIKVDLDFSQEDIDKMKKKFEEDGKFYFYQGYVKILNIEKYNQFSGEKNEIAKNKELSMIPDRVSKYFDRVSIGYLQVEDTSSILIRNQYINHNQNTEDRVSIGYPKNEEKKVSTIKLFEEKLEEIKIKANELYPEKDIEKATIDFLGYIKANTTKYKDFRQAFFNWVRNDRFNKYTLNSTTGKGKMKIDII